MVCGGNYSEGDRVFTTDTVSVTGMVDPAGNGFSIVKKSNSPLALKR